jgi:hypothetical protein
MELSNIEREPSLRHECHQQQPGFMLHPLIRIAGAVGSTSALCSVQRWKDQKQAADILCLSCL